MWIFLSVRACGILQFFSWRDLQHNLRLRHKVFSHYDPWTPRRGSAEAIYCIDLWIGEVEVKNLLWVIYAGLKHEYFFIRHNQFVDIHVQWLDLNCFFHRIRSLNNISRTLPTLRFLSRAPSGLDVFFCLYIVNFEHNNLTGSWFSEVRLSSLHVTTDIE